MNLWLAAIAILIVILLPVVLSILLRRRYRLPWLYFFVGALTFICAQIVHLPLNHLLANLGILPETGANGGLQLLVTAVVLGMTAAFTEELARAAGYALVTRARHYQDGLMMGLGHGGIESMLLGVLIAAGISSLTLLVQSGDLLSDLPPEQVAAVQQQLEMLANTPLAMLAPTAERIIALGLQVCLSVIVLQAFVRRNWFYLVAAIGIHALFDFVGVVAVQRIDSTWLLEAILALMLLPVALWVWRLKPSQPQAPLTGNVNTIKEIRTFLASLRKEILFQWHSRRLFIVLAVYLAFGMLSPLLARFTPELLGSLEGAEQFAELIPEPTIRDAIGQYIRNLTQFGFILVILLGMGAIAGEKERGTSVMILSKPLPRWAFVTSKFVAQMMVYALAFLLAATASYFYTSMLFGPMAILDLVLVNLLLFAWLSVFVAIALFGSALGNTTAAAAGIALLVSVMFLIVGTIPNYGTLFPGGLTVWANQIAAGEAITPNAGTLTMSLVLVILAILAGLAVFERQDI